MPYVLSEIPVPTFRTPTGLTPWWRPVAVGWPNTGASASYIGPRAGAIGTNVGTADPQLIADYFPQYRNAQFSVVSPIPTMTAAFGTSGTNMRPYQAVTRQPAPKPVPQSVINTAAGPMRVPVGVWVPPNPVFMVGSF